MGWGFPIFYSTKNKVFTSDEQNSIDKICRSLTKYTKKKFTIDFSMELNENYGEYIPDFIYENNLRVQTMYYTYNFEYLRFETMIIKNWATNKKQSETMLQWAHGKWDYFLKYKGKYTDEEVMPKEFRVKDINGIEVVTNSYRTDKGAKKKISLPSFYKLNINSSSDLGSHHILISYNSKWKKQLEELIKKKFEYMIKNI